MKKMSLMEMFDKDSEKMVGPIWKAYHEARANVAAAEQEVRDAYAKYERLRREESAAAIALRDARLAKYGSPSNWPEDDHSL